MTPRNPSRRPGPSVRTRVVEHRTNPGEEPAQARREDRLATEEPLEIRVASTHREPARVWVTMRTPGHDFELAAGYLVNEGLLRPEQLRTVAYCTDADLSPQQEFNVVTVTAQGHVDVPVRLGGPTSGSSACGVCGKDSVDAALVVPRGHRWSGPDPDPAVVVGLPDALRAGQTLFERTGGVHAAALADADGRIAAVREDIGRHNAVDKAIGARVLEGLPTADAYLVVSGRAGFELVQKAVAAGVGSLVAVGAPTSLAVDLARDAGLAVFGFTDPARTVRYA